MRSYEVISDLDWTKAERVSTLVGHEILGIVCTRVQNMGDRKIVTLKQETGYDGDGYKVWEDIFKADFPTSWPDQDCISYSIGTWISLGSE